MVVASSHFSSRSSSPPRRGVGALLALAIVAVGLVPAAEASGQAPVAQRVDPPASSTTATVNVAKSFSGQCGNPDRDLDRGEWYVQQPGGSLQMVGSDDVQFQGDPWGPKSRSVTFTASGLAKVRWRCVDPDGAASYVDWAVQVGGGANQLPTAQRVDPSTSSTTATVNVAKSFMGQCGNPDGNLARAEWYLQQPGGSLQLAATDNVQFQDNPWGPKTRSFTFTSAGEGLVRWRCVDQNGDSHHVDWSVAVQAASNQAPTAQRVDPPTSSATATVNVGRSFSGQCGNPDGNLARGEWFVQQPGGSLQQAATDNVQFQDNPWGPKSRSVTFNGAGSGLVRWRCVDQDGASSQVDWSVTVQGASNQAPTAQRVDPSTSSTTATVNVGRSFSGQCGNPDGNLARGEWFVQQPGGSLQQAATDNVQFQDNPWGPKSRSVTFSGTGSALVRWRCVDQNGDSHHVDWSVTVQAAGNQAPVAQRVDPAAGTVTVTQGVSRSFAGQCANPDGNLHRAEWQVRQPGGGWQAAGSDAVQVQSNPWGPKSASFTFTAAGPGGVRWTCFDQDGSSHAVEWTVDVGQPVRRPPVAERVDPPQADVAAHVGMPVGFRGQCRDTDGDLARGEWWVQQPQGALQIAATDTVQVASDPWGPKSREVTFTAAGGGLVRWRCVDQTGDAHHVDWPVAVAPAEQPRAEGLSPVGAAASVTVGGTLGFTGQCENPGRNLARGEWWVRQPGGSLQRVASSNAYGQDATWGPRSQSFAFDAVGDALVRWSCVGNDPGSASHADWAVAVRPLAENHRPTATARNGPDLAASPSYLRLEFTCRDDDGRIVAYELQGPRGEGWVRSSLGLFADPTYDATAAYYLGQEGRHVLRARCIDDRGGVSDPVSWDATIRWPTDEVTFDVEEMDADRKRVTITTQHLGPGGRPEGAPSIERLDLVRVRIQPTLQTNAPSLASQPPEFFTVLDYHSDFWGALGACFFDESLGKWMKKPVEAAVETTLETAASHALKQTLDVGIAVALTAAGIPVPPQAVTLTREVVTFLVQVGLCTAHGYEVPLEQAETWLVVGRPATLRVKYDVGPAWSADRQGWCSASETWRGRATPELRVVNVQVVNVCMVYPTQVTLSTVSSPLLLSSLPAAEQTEVRVTAASPVSVNLVAPVTDGKVTGYRSRVECHDDQGIGLQYRPPATFWTAAPDAVMVAVDGRPIDRATSLQDLADRGNEEDHEYYVVGNYFDVPAQVYGTAEGTARAGLESTVLVALKKCSTHDVDIEAATLPPAVPEPVQAFAPDAAEGAAAAEPAPPPSPEAAEGPRPETDRLVPALAPAWLLAGLAALAVLRLRAGRRGPD